MKILVISGDKVTDVIFATPLIAMLSRVKSAKVDVLTACEFCPVIKNNPHVGKVYFFSHPHGTNREINKLFIIFNRIMTIFKLRRQRYNVAIIARENLSARTLLWAKISRAQQVIAYGENTHSVVTHLVPKNTKAEHLVESYAKMANPLGIDIPPGPVELYPGPSELCEGGFTHFPLSKNPVYALQMTSLSAMLCWPADKFVELAHRLCEREVCQLLLLWSLEKKGHHASSSPNEHVQFILDNTAELPVCGIETNSIGELMAVLSHCKQALVFDEVTLHLAAGFNVPVVIMKENLSPERRGPWLVPNVIIPAPGNDTSKLTVDEVLSRFIMLRSAQE